MCGHSRNKIYGEPVQSRNIDTVSIAEDAFVTLTIYDTVGRVVRQFEIGHRIASV